MTILKKAIVIGASSGIGEEVAKVLSNEGYIVGLVARRTDNLLALQKNYRINHLSSVSMFHTLMKRRTF